MTDGLDSFTLAAGLAQGGPLSDVAREELLKLAVGFRRAGGSISWPDWCKLSPSTREVLEEAYTIVEGERLGVLCRALGVQFPEPRGNPTAPENRARRAAQAADEEADDLAEELADRIAARMGAAG